MNTEIMTLDLSTRRRSIIGYSLGMAVYVIVVVAIYPSFKNSTNLDQLTKDSPGVAALFGISGSLTSPTGWLSANIYANFFPLLILLVTIGYGATSLAGPEADGHLELVLSLPFVRWSVVAQKVAALVVQAAVFSAVVFGCVIVGRAFELTFDAGDLVTATLAVGMLGVDFGLLALAIGAATGERGTAIAIASAVAAASYLVNSMAPLVSWLGPAKYASLFYWSVGDHQLEQGLPLGAFAVLLVVAIILVGVAVQAFRRHDLS
jgi:ABC-2 type transport system permease protein